MAEAGQHDPRRDIPRTDVLLRNPILVEAARRLGHVIVKRAVLGAQQRARDGEIAPEEVAAAAATDLDVRQRLPTTLRPVLNATGVVLHTNIGRAPLTEGARTAIARASGYVDVELDLETGRRASRGRGTLDALLDRVPAAGAALVVNNGAGALVLATTALAAGREVLVSRGELVEIGDGFRLPDLVTSTGARLHEVGTTNRTTLRDYAGAVGPATAAILKVHPSNFRIEGFTSAASIPGLAGLARDHRLPLVVDIGSGLLHPEPLLPDEPDASTVLTDGASIVTSSGDKLLGGPQAGVILGEAAVVERLRRHPLARALRTDKLTLAALEATLRGGPTVAETFLRADPDALHARCVLLAEAVGGRVVPSEGAVGGGGAPGVTLSGWAVALPQGYAAQLRHADPAVLARVESGLTIVDLRCVPAESDDELIAAIRSVTDALEAGSAAQKPR
ncbi:MAG: L-seryl-tRNA(Sec) selenium transferase [Intrasporangium sp.]|uniref:L-seryl-tRNA(Sec) selenium transferase n=1 Tax=Intrasporangium sp. TaxID=1925024 RepID=UPI0026484490|nr:L-seryl-tRNA(Sec) selenium transferase [Intrasporangium sp.]MDN5796195.1 L-seryl-tRNA(Sec) selenium transferase [Intrasporangium sp.]